MSWARKTSHLDPRRPDAKAASALSREQVANDDLGDFTIPSASGIEVVELTQEEYENLLTCLGCPA